MVFRSGAIGGVIIFLLAAWYWDFWPFTGGNFRPIDYDHDYNVYFYYPNNKEVYLGQATGLGQCQNLARSKAANNNIRSTSWSYICCSIRKGSSCYEKER
jgi:hypothetical protein